MDTKVKTYSSEKNKQIAETFAATKLRRSRQIVLVLDFKAKCGKRYKMPQKQIDFFDNVFIEAKRLKNYVLSLSETSYSYDFDEFITEEHAEYLLNNNVIPEDESEENVLDVFKADQKDFKTVWYYTKGPNNPDTEYKEYKLQYLGSYAKADVLNTMCSNIKTLHTKKTQGEKVGHLKYVSEYNTIKYKKLGYGFNINVANAAFKIQGCPGWFKVWGIEQLSEIKKADPDYEVASATLVRNVDGDYHIHLTVYADRKKMLNYRKSKIEKKKYVKPGNEVVGIDFGCETAFTFSDGQKMDFHVEEPERLKMLQRRLKRCKKGSNNYWKTRQKL